MKNVVKRFFCYGYSTFINYYGYLLKTGSANLISLLALPFVARMYGAEDLGVYAVYSAFVVILSIISMLAYQNLVLTMPKEYEAKLLYTMCFYISLLTAFFFFTLYLIMPSAILNSTLGNKRTLFELLPITLILISLNTLNYTWLVRKRQFNVLANNKIILAFSTALIQILFGFMHLGYIGLMLANILGLVFSVFLVLNYVPKIRVLSKRKFDYGVAQVVKNRALAFNLLPGSLIDVLAIKLPDIAINMFFGAWWLGQYSMVQKIIAVPLAFLSSAVQDVFRQRIASAVGDMVRMQELVGKYLMLTIPLSMFIYGCLFFVVPKVLVILLGDAWTASATLLGVLGAVYCAQFISSPLSYILVVVKEYRKALAWQFAYLVSSVLVLFVPVFVFGQGDIHQYLMRYSLVMVAMYFIYMMLSVKSIR